MGPHQKHQLQVSGAASAPHSLGIIRNPTSTGPPSRACSSGGPQGHQERIPQAAGLQTCQQILARSQ